MGALKNFYDNDLTFDYLSAEDFDLMFDDEYELWLKAQETKLKLKMEKNADIWNNVGHDIGNHNAGTL